MGITFLFSGQRDSLRCDRMAENADTRGIERVNYLALRHFLFSRFLPIYFGAEHAKTIIDVTAATINRRPQRRRSCQQSGLPCC